MHHVVPLIAKRQGAHTNQLVPIVVSCALCPRLDAILLSSRGSLWKQPLYSYEVEIGYMFTEDSDVDLENLKSLVWDSFGRGVQYIFVGSSLISETTNKLESFQENLKDENVRFVDEYDESLLHLIFAGSDIILCSFNDPMLQIPVKAIKYGAVPVPVNVADDRLRKFIGSGNTERTQLSEYIINTFANVSLSQAIDEIKKKPSQWNRKILEAMSKDVSWDAECHDIHVSAYMSLKK